jgi:hypothetical protein
MPTVATAIFWTSLAMSIMAFMTSIYLLVRKAPSDAPPPPQGAGNVQLQAGISDVTKLVEAIAKLTDSFAKAGPAVMAMIGAIVFLLIAFLAAGLPK